MIEPHLLHGRLLPTAVIVGSAVIEQVVPLPPSSFSPHPYYQWHLAHVERAKRLCKPKGHPQPLWFTPFD